MRAAARSLVSLVLFAGLLNAAHAGDAGDGDGSMPVDLPDTAAVPGGVVILPIDAPADVRPVATLDGARAMVLRDNDRWVAVVGIPLGTKPGRQELVVTHGGKTERLAFDRSEERRVGKECRSRWSAKHYNKKNTDSNNE